jgi:hypothetical protein
MDLATFPDAPLRMGLLGPDEDRDGPVPKEDPVPEEVKVPATEDELPDEQLMWLGRS